MKKKILKKIVLGLCVVAIACTPVVAMAKPIDSGMDTYHGDLPEPQNAIAKQAIACAWPKGTPKGKTRWPGGTRKPAYSAALQKAYGSRSSWGKQTRAGASCDVFVGTVVRSSGYDTSFPRGLSGDKTYLPKTSKFRKVSVTSLSAYEPGDIIFYLQKGGGGHIAIYVEIDGTGYLAEASYSLKAYGRITERAHVYHPSHFRVFGIYRATGDCMATYSKGDQSDDVTKIQDFLKWAGFFKGKPDGIYGDATEKAVKEYQKALGAEQTGVFDKNCLDKAKTFVSDSVGSKAVGE